MSDASKRTVCPTCSAVTEDDRCLACQPPASEVVYGKVPRRFRIKVDPFGPVKAHPNGSAAAYFYGCYFPQTDLVIGEMGRRGTGMPEGVEWLDEPRETCPVSAITLYSFENRDGVADSGEYTTQDYEEAKKYARENRLRVVANEYEWADSERLEDYTTDPVCRECGEPCFVTETGVSHHGTPDEIDHDSDGRHVAVLDEDEDEDEDDEPEAEEP